MKFLLISDFHLMFDNPICRKDSAFKAGIDKLDYILNYAVENDCTILQAGDLFDVPRSWRLIAAVQDVLLKYRQKIYAVYGQHDNYMYSESSKPTTILGVLSKAGYIEVLSEKPIRFEKNIDVYGCSFGHNVPEVLNKENVNILVIHAPIVESKLWIGQENYFLASNFLQENYDYDLILCGDIHRKFFVSNTSNDRFILNTGCLLRIDADEYNFTYEPSFAIFDTAAWKIRWNKVPHKPSESVMSRKHILLKKENERMLDSFVKAIEEGRLKDSGAYSLDFKSNLQKYFEENSIGEDIRQIIFRIMEEEDEGK